MNKLFKGLLVVLLAAYVVSPVDLVPGPVDDIILLLCTLGGNYLAARSKKE